jgi:hypothetical protein
MYGLHLLKKMKCMFTMNSEEGLSCQNSPKVNLSACAFVCPAECEETVGRGMCHYFNV